MRTSTRILVYAAICAEAAAGLFAQEPEGQSADIVVVNAKVWTVDQARPRAEAVAVAGERIAAVGSNDGVRRLTGARTRMIDARGASVLPGFIDSHVHLASGGMELAGVQLKDAMSSAEFVRRIAERAKALPNGEWIVGGRWDHENWPGAALPTRQMIDALTARHPVYVSRYDGHMRLANTLALKLAGITRDTPVPDGGDIVKDKNGEPTGALKDAAEALVERIIPGPTEEQLTRAIRAALAHARALGVTGVHAMSSAHDLRVYQKLFAAGELTARIYAITPIEQWQAPAGAAIAAGFGGDWLRSGGVKGFADGSLGSTTALFFEPYNDAPHTSGLPAGMMFPEGNMLKMALAAFGSDWSVAPLDPLTGIHAAVTRATLDGKHPQGWYPEQKITLAEAIEGYTMGSAYAEGAEKTRGSIAVGKLADVVILDADLFVVAPEKIPGVRVAMTIVAGRVVYEAGKGAR